MINNPSSLVTPFLQLWDPYLYLCNNTGDAGVGRLAGVLGQCTELSHLDLGRQRDWSCPMLLSEH